MFLYSQDEWNKYMENEDCDVKGSKHWWFWMLFPKSAKKRDIEITYPCWLVNRVPAVVYTWGINSGLILMRDNVWFMKKMYIRHELGHILGHKHCWFPECMNTIIFFRWWIKKSLRGKIEIVD